MVHGTSGNDDYFLYVARQADQTALKTELRPGLQVHSGNYFFSTQQIYLEMMSNARHKLRTGSELRF